MMSKLDVVIEAQRTEFLSPADLLAAIEAEERGGDGLCPNRDQCFRERLGISQAAAEDGHRCGFEETHCLWQCHLSGRWQKAKTT